MYAGPSCRSGGGLAHLISHWLPRCSQASLLYRTLRLAVFTWRARPSFSRRSIP